MLNDGFEKLLQDARTVWQSQRLSGQHRCLGIYYGEDELYAVLVQRNKGRFKFSEPACIAVTGREDPATAPWMDELKNGLGIAGEPLPVALALSGHLYQTLDHHSEFTDLKQIERTLRFDIEEEVAADSDSLALCYQQRLREHAGCDLIVHAAGRDTLTEVFQQFENADLDALVALPDVVSWQNYLQRQDLLPVDQAALVMGWANGVFYLLVLNERHEPLIARSLLCPDPQGAAAWLQPELARCLARVTSNGSQPQLLYHEPGLDSTMVQLLGRDLQLTVQSLGDEDIRLAFAAGAAYTHFSDSIVHDFRRNQMEPKTLRLSRQFVLGGLVAAFCLLALSWGVVLHARAGRYDELFSAANNKLNEAKRVLPRDKIPRNVNQVNQNLKSYYNTLRSKSRTSGSDNLPDSAGYTLMLLLEALDQLPEDFDLDIETMRIGSEDVTIAGTVADLQGQETLQEVVRNDKRLTIRTWNFRQQSGDSRRGMSLDRWVFNIALQLAKTPERSTEPGSSSNGA